MLSNNSPKSLRLFEKWINSLISKLYNIENTASWWWLTSECPRICTLTRLCSTVASISRCAWTSCVSMCRQSSEKQFLSSTLAITDSWETILFSRYSTVSAWVYDKIAYYLFEMSMRMVRTARSPIMTNYVKPAGS